MKRYDSESGFDAAAPSATDLANLPPHSIEAEQGVLGCCFLEPNTSLGRCLEKLPGREQAFYDARHQALFLSLLGMFEARLPIDLISVQQRLKDQQQLEAVGGLAYLSGLMDTVPSAANLDYYLDIVREKHTLRRLLQACLGVVARVRESQDDVATIVSTAQREILAVVEGEVASDIKLLGDEFAGIYERLDGFRRGVKQMIGFETGFNYLDNMLCGLKPAEYIVVAGRPGGGKTMIAMQIAEHVSVDLGLPVGVFSLEMTREALATRQLFSRVGADQQKYRNGFLVLDDIPKLAEGMKEMRHAPFWVSEVSGLTPEELSVKARRMVHEQGVRLIIIDYLQLMNGRRGKRYDGRAQELADVSKEINRLKKELRVPFLVLAQMNREIEKDANRKPQLSDLKDTGQLEQDADVVLFLYDVNLKKAMDNPASEAGKAQLAWLGAPGVQKLPAQFRDPEEWPSYLRRMNLLVAKQRNGPTGDVALVQVKPWVRFIDAYTPAREGPAGRKSSVAQDSFEDAA